MSIDPATLRAVCEALRTNHPAYMVRTHKWTVDDLIGFIEREFPTEAPACKRCGGRRKVQGTTYHDYHGFMSEPCPDCAAPAPEPIRCEARCDQWPNCRHDWSAWDRREAPEPSTDWTCPACGVLGDRQSCRNCGAECRPAEPSDTLREEEIIRVLAAASPLFSVYTPTWAPVTHECALCDVQGESPFDLELHEPACPWRQAVEWVAATPAREDDERCEHDWIDIRNRVIESGEMCSRCGALRAAPWQEPSAREDDSTAALCEHGCLPGKPCKVVPCPALRALREPPAREDESSEHCTTCGGPCLLPGDKG